jgi:hypothetical protein
MDVNVQQWLNDKPVTETEIARLLDQRFGDGVVYLSRNMPRRVYNLALRKGYIDLDGHVTRKGRTLLASLNADQAGARNESVARVFSVGT